MLSVRAHKAWCKYNHVLLQSNRSVWPSWHPAATPPPRVRMHQALLRPALILISQAPRSRRPCKLLSQPCGRFDPSIAPATPIGEEAEQQLRSTACSSAAQLVRATVFLITQNISHHSDGRCHPPLKARLACSASSWTCRYPSPPRTLRGAASSPYKCKTHLHGQFSVHTVFHIPISNGGTMQNDLHKQLAGLSIQMHSYLQLEKRSVWFLGLISNLHFCSWS